ncbi:hypothetical protein ACQCLI_08235 [Pseudomonas nitroreducens]|uniref:hypothetical protein n=1 Tax=Pseudomonas TaxID=286 RepID=UPI0003154022|nr:hypothetical protein [Pseudomonas nitroreducens]
MTSDTNRFEEHREEGSSAQTSDQATARLSSATDEHLSGLPADPSVSAKGIARPALSAGYLSIQGGVVSPAGRPADTHAVEAFEDLERDLAELASACSGLGAKEPGCAESSESLARPDAETAAILLDSLRLPEQEQAQERESTTAEAAMVSPDLEPTIHFSHEERSAMNAQVQPATTDAASTRASAESAVTVRPSSAMETEGVLHDVQSTLDSLAGMAHGLSQQKLEIVKMREALEERRLATLERERQLAEREERLSQQEQRLQEEKQGIERIAEHNAAVLAERSSALQALAETVDSRDRATTKRAEILSQEQQSIDRQQTQLRARGQELDEREAGLQRQSSELAERFKQLLDAKERFGAIVKGFNETVRFNTTYSAISKTVGSGAEEA